MRHLAAAITVLLALSALGPEPAQARGENIARGKPYTLEPAPNYTYKPDPGDATQLTDGQHAGGNLWGDRGSVGWPSVGWMRTKPVIITIDLGSPRPIGGASFETAAGTAGVTWPASIFVLASDDGAAWTELGDLVALSAQKSPPPANGFAIHRFESDELVGRGRYVRFLVDDGPGPFVFVDEIEVYAGSPERAKTQRAALRAPIRDSTGTTYFAEARTRTGIERAARRDLDAARARVAGAAIDADLRRELTARLDAAAQALAQALTPDPATFRAILPMSSAQASAFAVLGALDRASGAPPITAWVADPWAPLAPTAAAPVQPGAVRVAVSNGEVRAAAINLRAAGESPGSVRLTVDGLPAGASPAFVAAVAYTEMASGAPVATALLPAPREDDGHRIELAAGITQQVWLQFAPRDVPPGRYGGTIRIRTGDGATAQLPIEVRVFAEPFPVATRLHIGGWDDTDSDDHYGLTPQNVEPLIRHLRERGVDSPWGMAASMPFPQLDPTGRQIAAPASGRFDRWLERWPGARRYLVFVNAQDQISGVPRSSPAFDDAVAGWLRFWADHARERGVRPEQISLLLVDEPSRSDQEERVAVWAKAVRASGTGIRVWENPTRSDPREIPSAFLNSIDVLCANRLLGKLGGASYWSFFRSQRTPTRSLELYGAEGPAHLLDPYSYYRLQAWHAAAIDADGIHFWAFGDTGGASSWNDFAATRQAFTPLFLSRDDVTGAKQMEAIREGAEDYELVMRLRERVEEVARTTPSHPALSRARALASGGVERVLSAPGANELVWSTAKDRSAADAVRIEIEEALDALRNGG